MELRVNADSQAKIEMGSQTLLASKELDAEGLCTGSLLTQDAFSLQITSDAGNAERQRKTTRSKAPITCSVSGTTAKRNI